MTTDQVLLGIGLILALAVGSQVLAERLRIPPLIVLLPAGFIAGALTSDVDPRRLLGPSFEPLVSLAVAVILYDAGLGLDVSRLRGHARRVVRRLIVLGVPITCAFGALAAAPLLGMSAGVALMLGAILVVSGPTVVGPLLAFIRPSERLQRVLAWEGSLIDPVGGILGAVVFHAVLAGDHPGIARQAGQFAGSLAIGLAGGAVGTALLWALLCKLGLGEVLGTAAQLAAVVAVAAGCDILRDDTGLIAAIVMGLAVANRPSFDTPARRPFFETLVQLVIGVLFVAISATVTPSSLRHLIAPTLALVGVLVVVARPLVAMIAALGTDLARGERLFIGWMAPRGIVAAATATTFSAQLAARGLAGATKILPVTFLVIVATVTLYGLTAVPAARKLGVTRRARARPLLVGGNPWVVEVGQALRAAGLEVLMWAGAEPERAAIAEAGLELAPGQWVADASGGWARLEGVTAVLLMTDEDDFNALASTTLRGALEGPVYRLAPAPGSAGVVTPFTGGHTLFGPGMSGPEVGRRHRAGAPIVTRPADGAVPAGHEPLFLVHGDGGLTPVTSGAQTRPSPGDTLVLLGPVPAAAP